MSLSEMLKRREIERTEPDRKSAELLLKAASSDLDAAKSNLQNGHPEWALAIAYNAMLQAGRALMAAKGYRATSEFHHVAVVRFCAIMFPDASKNLTTTFERYRNRRHDVVYGEVRAVGEDEASRAIENARQIVEVIGKLMAK